MAVEKRKEVRLFFDSKCSANFMRSEGYVCVCVCVCVCRLPLILPLTGMLHQERMLATFVRNIKKSFNASFKSYRICRSIGRSSSTISVSTQRGVRLI